MRMDEAWVCKRYYLLRRNDFSVAQCRKAQLLLGSSALVLGSVRQVRFGHSASVCKVRQVAVVWWWHKHIGCCMHESA